MMITKTMFHLYLVRLGLFLDSEIEQDKVGFVANVNKIQEPKKEDFTYVVGMESCFQVFLSFREIEKSEVINSKFYEPG